MSAEPTVSALTSRNVQGRVRVRRAQRVCAVDVAALEQQSSSDPAIGCITIAIISPMKVISPSAVFLSSSPANRSTMIGSSS